MIRTQRNQFMSNFTNADSNGYKTIYRDLSSVGAKDHRNIILIVLAAEWPSRKGLPIKFKDAHENAQAEAIVSNLFRIANFFENALLSPVNLIDVKVGCVKARYSYSLDVGMDVISRAIFRFNQVRFLYDSTNATAHHNGRLIQSE